MRVPFTPMLTGDELIDFVEANQGVSEPELARAAGYLRVTKTGREQVLKKRFMAAVLAAKDLTIGAAPIRDRGKTAQYVTTVHTNGVILLGNTYSKAAGCNPGDKLLITVAEGEVRVTLDERADKVTKSTSRRPKQLELEPVAA